MAEAQGNDLVRRSDIYKLFGMRGTATLHVAQIDQLPAVDVMKLPTVQRMEKELAEAKFKLVSSQMADERLKEYFQKAIREKKKPVVKVKALARSKSLAERHADGIRTNIHIVDEWATVGPQPTPPRSIRPELNPGDTVIFASEVERKVFGEKQFLVKTVFGEFAAIEEINKESFMKLNLIANTKDLKLIRCTGRSSGKER